jgi:hypothetical protein
MGRANKLPVNREAPVKLSLVKLPWVDGDYTPDGTYWGYVIGTNIYWATNGETEVFVMAASRQDAKAGVIAELPLARFYR